METADGKEIGQPVRLSFSVPKLAEDVQAEEELALANRDKSMNESSIAAAYDGEEQKSPALKQKPVENPYAAMIPKANDPDS